MSWDAPFPTLITSDPSSLRKDVGQPPQDCWQEADSQRDLVERSLVRLVSTPPHLQSVTSLQA